MTFNIGKKSFTLPKEDYVMKLKDEVVQQVVKSGKISIPVGGGQSVEIPITEVGVQHTGQYEDICIFAGMPSEEMGGNEKINTPRGENAIWILGLPFFRKYSVQFDWPKSGSPQIVVK